MTAQSDKVVAAARAQLGKPYKRVSFNPTGPAPASFDCSSLTEWCFGQAGVTIPGVSTSQFAAGPKVGSPSVGDLVFFTGSDPPSPGHVGICVATSGTTGTYISAYDTAEGVVTKPFTVNGGAGGDRWVGATSPTGGGGAQQGGFSLSNPLGGLDGIMGVFDGIGSLLAKLSDPKLWIRIGKGALGLLLLAFGAIMVFSRTSAGGAVNKIKKVSHLK